MSLKSAHQHYEGVTMKVYLNSILNFPWAVGYGIPFSSVCVIFILLLHLIFEKGKENTSCWMDVMMSCCCCVVSVVIYYFSFFFRWLR